MIAEPEVEPSVRDSAVRLLASLFLGLSACSTFGASGDALRVIEDLDAQPSECRRVVESRASGDLARVLDDPRALVNGADIGGVPAYLGGADAVLELSPTEFLEALKPWWKGDSIAELARLCTSSDSVANSGCRFHRILLSDPSDVQVSAFSVAISRTASAAVREAHVTGMELLVPAGAEIRKPLGGAVAAVLTESNHSLIVASPTPDSIFVSRVAVSSAGEPFLPVTCILGN